MKTLVFATLLALGLTICNVQAAPNNLFPEGNFETMGKKNMAEGWRGIDPNWKAAKDAGATTTIEDAQGDHYLHVSNPGPAEGMFGAGAVVSLPPGAKTIRITYRIRAEIKETVNSPEGNGAAFIVWWRKGTDNIKYASSASLFLKKSTGDWLDKEVVVDVYEGADSIDITCALKNATGTVDLNDVAVYADE